MKDSGNAHARELLCSVIVPTCHRPDFLAFCLERLAPGRQTLAACHYEVVVTDDSRNPASRRMVQERFPWARWAASRSRGLQSTMLSASKACRSRLVLREMVIELKSNGKRVCPTGVAVTVFLPRRGCRM